MVLTTKQSGIVFTLSSTYHWCGGALLTTYIYSIYSPLLLLATFVPPTTIFQSWASILRENALAPLILISYSVAIRFLAPNMVKGVFWVHLEGLVNDYSYQIKQVSNIFIISIIEIQLQEGSNFCWSVKGEYCNEYHRFHVSNIVSTI